MSKDQGGIITFHKQHSAQAEISRGLAANQFSLIRAGRRFGKTTMLEDIAAYQALKGLKVGWFTPTYKLLTPTFASIRRTLQPAVKQTNKTEGLIELKTRGLVEFWTLTDEDAGRSRNYDLVIIDEAGLVKKGLRATWEQAIRPTLIDRDGRAIMAGTPKGIDDENFFYIAATEKKLGWTEFHAPTHKNPMLSAAAVARIQGENSPLVYQQEYLAEFVDWSGAAFFSLDALLDNGRPVAYPAKCDTVFCTIDTAIKTGAKNDGTAVVYWAYDRYNPSIPLTILDWDIIQVEGALLEAWMPSVFQRMAELRTLCGCRYHETIAHMEDKATGTILIQQAARRGWPVQAIDSVLTSVGKDERAISVSGYVHRGAVKISQYAYDKETEFKQIRRNHFLTQVRQFKIGVDEGPGTDDLVDCFTYGIAVALGDSGGI